MTLLAEQSGSTITFGPGTDYVPGRLVAECECSSGWSGSGEREHDGERDGGGAGNSGTGTIAFSAGMTLNAGVDLLLVASPAGETDSGNLTFVV